MGGWEEIIKMKNWIKELIQRPKRQMTWKKKDTEKLKKLVDAFNEKVAQVGDNQPNQIKYSDLVSNIYTRKDYRRIYDKYKRYLKKGAEKIDKGTGATEWEVKEFLIAKADVNKKRKAEKSKLTPKTYEGTGGYEDYRYEPITRNPESIKNFDRYLKHLEKQQGDAYYSKMNMLYSLNYRQAIIDQFGNSNFTQEIMEILSKLDNDTIARTIESDPFTQIEFVYDENQELELRGEKILEAWQKLL